MIEWLKILLDGCGITTVLLCVLYIIRAGYPKDWSKSKQQSRHGVNHE